MKKRFTLLGLIAIVVITLSAFAVSASEKHENSINCEDIISNVSCETLMVSAELIVTEVAFSEGRELVKHNDLAELSNDTFSLAVVPYVDRYRRRSQEWIKWNNINAIGKSLHAKHVAIDVSITTPLLC